METAFTARENESGAYDAWILENEPGETDLLKQREEAAFFLYRPLISVVVPVYETDEGMLIRMIESVRAQTYENWELCIADGNSSKAYIREKLQDYSNRDERIKVTFLKENQHIAEQGSNSAPLRNGIILFHPVIVPAEISPKPR